MTLVEDAHRAWKWFTTWGLIAIAATPHLYDYAMAISGALQANQVAVPAPLKWTITGLAIATGIGRVIKQGQSDVQPHP